MGKLSNYRVWLQSKPGMYEQYDGYVDVVAPNAEQAQNAAFNKLKRTYPDRNRGMWTVYKIERRNCLAP